MRDYQPGVRKQKYNNLFDDLFSQIDLVTATINEELEQAGIINHAYNTIIDLLNNKINLDYARTTLHAIRVMQAQHARFLLRQAKIANANHTIRQLVIEIDNVYASTLDTNNEAEPEPELTQTLLELHQLLLDLNKKMK